MPDMPKAVIQPTRFDVSCLPLDDINALGFTVTVEYRGRDKWAVLNSRWCLSSTGEWDWESIPSEREDDWLATHRFDLETAKRLAMEAAPKMTCNGWTVADALASIQRRAEEAEDRG
ncbi:hypothetical protein [Nonomuraea pusilla]|uniref:Uncharacterized protein n=1 Tax=Nonomuraea pusilla TaxID=46177 RepID=A0A1H8K5R9_9ACTN|nr:hypothetical protein [Nonomuraea pusilla]SEN88185.1 hypothetical protein SAMN05660976_08528 [Nonomuraea pusilla]